ncbi:hypothetical protein EW146_g9547 [Bondarzewia mesenterica]|uniref:BTB domain-containing protein n=1 Tax=Bondarzewia mesenterica TaxID=1095465 RepID=A0A4S4LAI4_9AGAM|nr:hypothetical protein EW146_g9547 [Bondarzewia mesenterica]
MAQFITDSDGTNSTSSVVHRHDELYYLDNAVFLVEDILFKVPRRGLEGIFQTMFSLSPDAISKGGNDEDPIRLPNTITSFEFRSFLKVLYPLGTPLDSLQDDEWVAVLGLSTMWRFPEIRTRAIEKLNARTLNPLKKLMLAKQHRVSAWLIEGYESLARRKTHLTVEERSMLGWDTFAGLVELRELSWEYVSCLSADDACEPVSLRRARFDFVGNIRRIFQRELRDDEEYRPSDEFTA